MNMFVKMAGDLPSIQKSFFRNFVAAVFAAGVVLKNNTKANVNRQNIGYLLLRSAFGTIGILCNFYAVDHLVIADASMLNKMSPFFAVLFSMLILKEKVTWQQTTLIIGAFIGSMFVVKPTFSNMDLIPSMIGLAGGICAGMAYTMVRKLGEIGTKGPFVVLFFSSFSCFCTLPFLIFNYHPMSVKQIVILMLAGTSAAVAQFAITAAYMFAPAKEISIFDYSQVIFAAILGFFVLDQVPDLWSWIGYFVICFMALCMFLYNKSRNDHAVSNG